MAQRVREICGSSTCSALAKDNISLCNHLKWNEYISVSTPHITRSRQDLFCRGFYPPGCREVIANTQSVTQFTLSATVTGATISPDGEGGGGLIAFLRNHRTSGGRQTMVSELCVSQICADSSRQRDRRSIKCARNKGLRDRELK